MAERHQSSTCCEPHEAKGEEAPEARVAALFRALSEPTHLAFLRRIREAPTPCVAGGEATGDLAPAAALEPIRALRSVGLVQGVIEGSKPCFCLNRSAFNELIEFLRPFAER